VGESERALAHHFRLARQHAPAVIFFDEVDALFGAKDESAHMAPGHNQVPPARGVRGLEGNGTSDANVGGVAADAAWRRLQLFAQLLHELDDLAYSDEVRLQELYRLGVACRRSCGGILGSCTYPGRVLSARLCSRGHERTAASGRGAAAAW